MHPWLTLLMRAWTRPHQLGLQLARYAEIISTDAGPSAEALRRRALWLGASLLLLTLACILAGVALLLWAAFPAGTLSRPWVVLAVPATPLIAGLLSLLGCQRVPRPELWPALKAQIDTDVCRLRAPAAAGTPAPSTARVLGQGALASVQTLLQPTANAHPLALVGGAAAVGALLMVVRPWRGLLRPSLLTSLGTQWLLKTLALRALQASSSAPAAPAAPPIHRP